MAGIDAEAASLDLDLACTVRLVNFDYEREQRVLEAQRMNMRQAVGEAITIAFGGTIENDDDDDTPELSEDDVL